MADIFHANGYFAYGFVNNSIIDSWLGFEKGFHIHRQMADKEIFSNLWEVLDGKYVAASLLSEQELREFDRLLQQAPSFNLVKNPGFEK